MVDREILAEFLQESNENLVRLDQEMVELEQRQEDAELLASVFRTIHTIKGTCGFLGLQTLGRIAHSAENLLVQIRSGEQRLVPELVSVILEAVDAIRVELSSLESTGGETGESHEAVMKRLDQACRVQPPGPAKELVKKPEGIASQAGKTETAPRAGSVSESAIRVDVRLLDRLMNLVGELVLTRNQFLQLSSRREDALLHATSQRLNLITAELQEGVMKTRMQPVGVVWDKLPRVVRDFATASGKQIVLEMHGKETDLDRTMIEAIKDPLTHIVRNSCDHGIELPEVRVRNGKTPQGRLTLRAYHQNGQVNIEIADDGAGIDPEKVRRTAVERGFLDAGQAARLSTREVLRLIFLPGFSTAKNVTSVSGRGVGMDVVRTNIERIGGSVGLNSEFGAGTTLQIRIPLTLAIIPGLVVSCAGERFIVPQVNLVELVRAGQSEKANVECLHGARLLRRRGRLLPVVHLADVLGLDQAADTGGASIAILQAGDRQFGLLVDDISDTQEIVVKPLGKHLKSLPCYAGATIMGDGKLALILDVTGIAQRAGVLVSDRSRLVPEQAAEGSAEGPETQGFLLFRAAGFDRLAVPLPLVARMEEFARSSIEKAGGRAVIQYRGQLLPLVTLEEAFGRSGRPSCDSCDPVPAVVFSDGNHRLGLLVDQIVDIVHDTISTRRPAAHSGLVGSCVIGGQVTDVLDLYHLLETVDPGWFGSSSGARTRGLSILLADNSSFFRALARNHLEMAGHKVLEATDSEEALKALDRHRVDVLLAAVDLPSGGGANLVKLLRGRAAFATLPAIALTEARSEPAFRGPGADQFQDWVYRSEMGGMISSIARLATVLQDAPGVCPARSFGSQEVRG